MPPAQNKNNPIRDRKVLNLCSNESDSQWLIKNMANKVYVLEPKEIDEKLENGEINTIFFRASEQSVDGFKTMSKLLQDNNLKHKGCQLIIIDDTKENNLLNYMHERMTDILVLFGFRRENYSLENVDYSVYS